MRENELNDDGPTEMTAERLRHVSVTNKARWRAIVEHLPAGVLVADRDGRIVLENARVVEILGHSLMHIQSVGDYGTLSGRDAQATPLAAEEYPLPRALRGERLTEVEYQWLRPDGRTIWGRVSAVPIIVDGVIDGAVVLFWNIDAEKAADAALAAAAEQQRLAYTVGRVGHFEWNIKTGVNRWSPEIEALYGVEPGAFGGTYEAWRARVHPDDIERVEARLTSSLQTGGFSDQWRVIRPDGTIACLAAEARIYFDDDGRPERMVGINMDVTAREEAEQALREVQLRHAVALDAAQLGAWHLNPQTGEMRCTARCKANFGRGPDDPFGYDDLLAAIHPDDLPTMQAAVEQALSARQPYACRYRVTWPDGTRRWIDAQGRATYDARGVAVAMDGVTADVTERHELESKLADQARELRDNDRRKDLFLATLSHELRSPLGAIENALHVMQRSLADPAMLERAHAVMHRQVRHVSRLIDDLLEVTRIAEGKLSLDRDVIDVRECVMTAVETARPQLESRQQPLDVQIPDDALVVQGDRRRLTQVFVNLLSNAAKYSPPGSRVTVRATTDGREVAVATCDEGLGIAPEMLVEIFEPLKQLPEHQTFADGGLGLGLALVRSIVTLHGGDVRASSAGPGFGSEFVVTLPAVNAVRS